ncbi:MAG: hypothetical protein R3C68_08390 [Myxococcota bacterium]
MADPAIADSDVDLARGVALFELARLPEAEKALRSALRGDPELAEAYYTLALVAELSGSGEDVELFRQARRLAPERYPARPQMPRNEFEEIVTAAMSELSDRMQEQLRDIPVMVAKCHIQRILNEHNRRFLPRPLACS